MRFLYGILISLCAANSALADSAVLRTIPTPITDLSEFSGAKNATRIEWSNQRPEQQRALNQFYRSINPNLNNQPSVERQQHVKQLRSMTPQQRQQMFLNYIQQNR